MTAKKRFKRMVRRRAVKTGESYSTALGHLRASQKEPADVTTTKPTANCSFCGKANTEVRKIVAGPGVYICDECVGLCNEVIEQVVRKPDSVPRAAQPSVDRLLAWLPSVGQTLRSVEADLAGKVAELRGQGVAWSRIAEALGMTEAEVFERFSTAPDP